jgi:hypothetical protein
MCSFVTGATRVLKGRNTATEVGHSGWQHFQWAFFSFVGVWFAIFGMNTEREGLSRAHGPSAEGIGDIILDAHTLVRRDARNKDGLKLGEQGHNAPSYVEQMFLSDAVDALQKVGHQLAVCDNQNAFQFATDGIEESVEQSLKLGKVVGGFSRGKRFSFNIN